MVTRVADQAAFLKSALARFKASTGQRSQRDVQDKLRAVEDACRGTQNLMYPVLEAVKAYCTLGEVCDVFRKVWGAYREKGTF